MSRINVVGAAIAGPAAALRLSRLGHEVLVYEARPEADLYSAGILGMTRGVWATLQSFDVEVEQYRLDNWYTDYTTMNSSRSPFVWITWTGLHKALVAAAQDAGARFYFEHVINDPEHLDGITVDATGVAGAARRGLPHTYSGHTIYRGLSDLNIDEEFTTYREQAGTYFTIGYTPEGAFWAYFVPRPEPKILRTVTVKTPPPEYINLPVKYRRIIRNTRMIARSPLSDWKVPAHMHNYDRTYFTVGDVNGPVRPVTTSGANLAVMEGFSTNHLVGASGFSIFHAETEILTRRAYDLELGQVLEAPEIGGTVSDIEYVQHHMMLFPENFQ